jgi:hypothetical protein
MEIHRPPEDWKDCEKNTGLLAEFVKAFFRY